MSNDLLSRRAHRSGADDVAWDYPIPDDRYERRVAAVTPEKLAQRAIEDSPLTEAFFVLEENIEHAIRQARDEAIEEAAKVAEGYQAAAGKDYEQRYAQQRHDRAALGFADGGRIVARNIATAIRSLKGKQ